MKNGLAKSLVKELLPLTVEAVIIAAVASLVGVLVNFFHPEAIAWIADRPYETLVPCPVPGGPAEPCPEPIGELDKQHVLFVDARSQKEFSTGHPADAINIEYDYLEPISEAKLQELSRLVARKKPRRIVVYGDGGNPDSGEQLGRELSGAGFKNVCFIKGGAPALGLGRLGEKT